MVSWWTTGTPANAGGITGYRAASGGPTMPGAGEGGAFWQPGAPVDTSVPTRYGADLPATLSHFAANARVRITYADWNPWAVHNGVYWTDYIIRVKFYVAPANSLVNPTSPTIEDIQQAAWAIGSIFNSYEQVSETYNTPTPANPNKDVTFNMVTTGLHGFLTPNTKYWIAAVPVLTRTDAPSNQIGSIIHAEAMPNMVGRALSFWTNRTPAAPLISVSGNPSEASGTVRVFSLSSQDPDSATGGTTSLYSDCAGVEVQYRQQPTPANPSPPWQPVTTYDASGVSRSNWFLDRNTAGSASAAMQALWTNGSLNIQRGGAPGTNQIYVPAGDIQLRARTFQYGFNLIASSHGNAPAGNANYTPTTFPAAHTSPWSNVVSLSAFASVPPPEIIEPTDYRAVQVNDPITLRWQHRSASTPIKGQSKVSIRARATVGDGSTPPWFNVVSNLVTSSQSLLIQPTHFIPQAGILYEWQVKTWDTSNVESDWSDIGAFWVVAPANSGPNILPGDTIEGATLGCGSHRAFVYRRGGKKRVGEITNISSLEWNRVRDDISTAKVVVSGWDDDCGGLLKRLQTWAYELVIFRDNGFGVERVWEGPITLLTYEKDSVTIQARDVMAYGYRRIIRQRMTHSGTDNPVNVVTRAREILQNAFAPDDPNLLRYLTTIDGESANQYRTTPAFSRTVFEEIDDMAANAGLDYTAVGRRIMLWGTKNPVGVLPEFRDEDLGSPPIVSEYGMSMANVYVVSDGNGVWGVATAPDSGVNTPDGQTVFGNDDSYGLVEMLSSSWASDSDVDTGTYTEQGLETIRNSFREYAENSIADRYPPPVVVRVPDNTSLNPDSVISIQSLVPGVAIPLRTTSTLRPVFATQKLDALKVTETNGVETVQITLSPFRSQDNQMEEAE